jgi:hypothetical protein
MISTDNQIDLPFFLSAMTVFVVLAMASFLVYERAQPRRAIHGA